MLVVTVCVVAVLVGGYCCDNIGGCAIVVGVVVDDLELIYYFNVL